MSFFNSLFGSSQEDEDAVNRVNSIGRVYPSHVPGEYNEMANGMYTTTTSTTGGLVPPGGWQQLYQQGQAQQLYQQWQAQQKSAARIDPNTQPEMQMSLEDAHGLWLAKFGDQWVTQEVVRDTVGFNWSRVAARLTRAMLVECAVDSGYYRLVPKSWK